MTIATLTGHAVLAVGPYSSIMDNGPAKVSGTARQVGGRVIMIWVLNKLCFNTGPGGWGQGWRHVRDQHHQERGLGLHQGQERGVCDSAAVQQRGQLQDPQGSPGNTGL